MRFLIIILLCQMCMCAAIKYIGNNPSKVTISLYHYPTGLMWEHELSYGARDVYKFLKLYENLEEFKTENGDYEVEIKLATIQYSLNWARIFVYIEGFVGNKEIKRELIFHAKENEWYSFQSQFPFDVLTFSSVRVNFE